MLASAKKLVLQLGSFIVPIGLERCSSNYSGYLEVNWENGRKVLNSPSANYSEGSLRKVWRAALRYFKFAPPPDAAVLILGWGAGSLAALLQRSYQHQGFITAVEKDPAVCYLARRHFAERLLRVELIQADARDFLTQCTRQYDYVFTDIFVDRHVPEHFRRRDHLRQVQGLLRPGGAHFQNFMMKDRAELRAWQKTIQEPGMSMEWFYWDDSNCVIRSEKPTN